MTKERGVIDGTNFQRKAEEVGINSTDEWKKVRILNSTKKRIDKDVK